MMAGRLGPQALRRAGAEVIGLDIATNLLEQARKRAADEKLKIEFVETDKGLQPDSGRGGPGVRLRAPK